MDGLENLAFLYTDYIKLVGRMSVSKATVFFFYYYFLYVCLFFHSHVISLSALSFHHQLMPLWVSKL